MRSQRMTNPPSDAASSFKVGQSIRWQPNVGGAGGEAVIMRLLNDRDEGYSREVDGYVSMSIEARAIAGPHSGSVITFIVGTDGRIRLDGRVVIVSAL